MELSAEQVQSLLDTVAGGDKLSTEERRSALKQIKAKRPDMSLAELGRLLGVTPPVISRDLELQQEQAPTGGDPIIEDAATAYANFMRQCDAKMALLQESLNDPDIGARERIAAIRSMHDVDCDKADYKIKFLKDTPSADPTQYQHLVYVDPGKGATIMKDWAHMSQEERDYMDALASWNEAWEAYRAYEADQGRAMPQRTQDYCREHGWQDVASTNTILKCGCKGI
jgi:hypothetical protein